MTDEGVTTIVMHYRPRNGGFGCNTADGLRSSYLWAVTCQQCLGPTQRAILDRAASGLVMARDNKERMAARRLVRRGILRHHLFGSPGMGYLTVYVVQA